MRSVEESRKKWETIRSRNSTPIDLKTALKDPKQRNPCEDGLRSVCWKDFLLYGRPDQSSWPKKLSDSRSAYTSLRDHFLRYIEHPDDLQSTSDPLSDDNSSPWSSIRQDETNRAEIFQDVERCLQDNFFFREPSTQKMLLDILFIYSKLHPDTGYRQGMHELLAPVLWVVARDAIDPESINKEGTEDPLMLEALDARYIEHDAFTLFCVIMQTTKSFYELGDVNPGSSANSPIVVRSHRIHGELLSAIDPELAAHLHVIEILPQIFLIRWIRLLFGREFAFEDVLSIWDWLFAETLSLSLIDYICVAMLLRIRWELMEADYSSALTLLLRYVSPPAPNEPSTLVQDALYLQENPTAESGANLISKYTGRKPSSTAEKRFETAPPTKHAARNIRNRRGIPASWNGATSPSRSPARTLPQQRGLESLFQDVSGEIQRRTESWSVAKAVRGAVGEVRRNLDNLQSGPGSPRADADIQQRLSGKAGSGSTEGKELAKRIETLETRNKALAKMLGDALESLRSQNEKVDETPATKDQAFNLSLAKLQFVQVYLNDSSIPIPSEDPPQKLPNRRKSESQDRESKTPTQSPVPVPSVNHQRKSSNASSRNRTASRTAAVPEPASTHLVQDDKVPRSPTPSAKIHQPRPSLANSSFSWILGDSRHQSSFISSASEPPEQRRDSGAKGRPGQLFGESKVDESKKGSESDDGMFTLNSLRGTRSP